MGWRRRWGGGGERDSRDTPYILRRVESLFRKWLSSKLNFRWRFAPWKWSGMYVYVEYFSAVSCSSYWVVANWWNVYVLRSMKSVCVCHFKFWIDKFVADVPFYLLLTSFERSVECECLMQMRGSKKTAPGEVSLPYVRHYYNLT